MAYKIAVITFACFFANIPAGSSFLTSGHCDSSRYRYNPRATPQACGQNVLRGGERLHMARKGQDISRRLESNDDENASNDHKEDKLLLRRRAQSLAIVTSLFFLGQGMTVTSAEASYGRFSASVNPPTRISCVETARVRDGAESLCQPASFISGLKADFPTMSADDTKDAKPGKPAKSKAKVRDNEQMLKHQKMLDDLSKEPEWFNFLSAFLASAISTLIIHPLDTIKVRLMAEKNGKGPEESDDNGNGIITSFDSSATVPTRPGQTRGGAFDDESRQLSSKLSITPPAPQSALSSTTALSAVAVTCNEKVNYEQKDVIDSPRANSDIRLLCDDIRSLYDGVIPNLFKEAPPSALYLGLYESSSIFLKQLPFFAHHNLLTYLLAGAIGEMAGSIVRAPAEAVKTRVQTGMGLGSAMKTVFMTKDGRSNTITAWSSSIFRDVPAGAAQIAIFEILKTLIIASSYNIDVDNLISESILGGVGGGIGAFLTTPSDRVTTMIMSSEEELSAFAGAKMIYDEYGIEGFFVGSTERSSYWFFAIGIFLSVYCATRQAAIPFFI